MTQTPILAELQALTKAALPEVEALFADGPRHAQGAGLGNGGKVSNQALEATAIPGHALAWLATYVEALRQLNAWAGRLSDGRDNSARWKQLILQIGFGEYLTQIAGGIPMSQTEFARLSDLGLTYTPGPAAAS